MADQANQKSISRRRFLKKTGWIAAGVTVAAFASLRGVRAAMPALPTFNGPGAQDGLAWVQALPDGRIRFFCPRMEMGQGAGLGLAQVVAEELNVDQAQIDAVLPDTDQALPFQMTVGSESLTNFFDPVSYGAAQLREALRVLAAQQTGFTIDQIKDGRAGFILPDGSAVTYGALVTQTPMVVPQDALLADDALERYAVTRTGSYRTIGQRWPHHELQAIVTGQMVYSRDVTIPQMAYGAVIYPPAFGARLQSADGQEAEAMAGVVGVLVDTGDNFVGVVADNPFVLASAIEAIETRWLMPDALDQDQIEARIDVDRVRADDDFAHTLLSSGDIDTGRANASVQGAARYDTPLAAHAAIEPRSGLVWVRDDKVEAWSASQDPFYVQRLVAKAIDRDVSDVVVHTHRIGGGFGGRIPCQATEAAARLSGAFNRPVRVQWDRETEFQNNYFQPIYSHHIDAGVTADGIISHWDHGIVSSSIFTGFLPELVGRGIDVASADEGTVRGAIPQYRIANRRVQYKGVRTAVPISAWRGLGAAPNTFAIESMMDELAVSAGIDPLQFRLQNLATSSARLADVLRRVAGMSGWGRSMPANSGLGLACAVYKDKTAAAVVTEVQVDHEARQLRVSRAWCAQDCGLVINPHQVESQIMGNIVWGCSMTLKERISIEAGHVGEDNFHTYEPLRHHEAPKIEIALVLPGDAAPSEVGESALGPVPAAIANAVFAATERRVRRLPMDYDSVFA